MTVKSPLALVKERFQDKEGLVKAVKELATEQLWIDRVDSDKGLDSVSNKKLLRLHETLTAVKSFGGREKLIGAILEQEKRTKDDGFKGRLSRFSTPRLWDQYNAGQRRAKA